MDVFQGVFCMLFALYYVQRCNGSDVNSIPCSDVKYVYVENGFNDDDVPKHAISGDHLQICQNSLTCCTMELEDRLKTYSHNEFSRHLKYTVNQIRSIFATYTLKFDEFFKELMNTSRKDFHEMFLKTYGTQYETNSYIFMSMFDDLEKYYLTGGVNLADALESFFQHLYKKMYQVLNVQYKFGENHLNCIVDYMDEMKPFGDVPKKLTLEVKRSFTATRTFVQALAIGRDVARNMLEVLPASNCDRSLTKMAYCPRCHGLPELKPCANYCLTVMQECLSQHAKLEEEWSNYIDALSLLGSRLESSFNIESVVNPINIKISDAIMNFQENGHLVSKKLFDKCGKPRLQKRNVHELTFETLKFSNKQPGIRPTTAAGTSLDRLIQNLRKRLRRMKGYWSRLPQAMCDIVQLGGGLHKEGNDCWNGLDQARLEDHSFHQLNVSVMPEIDVSPSHDSLVNQQLLTIKLITTKLSDAYNGMEVEWLDADSDWMYSGSGSGSGSGHEPVAVGPTEGYGDIYFSTSAPAVDKGQMLPTKPTKQPSSSAFFCHGHWAAIFASLVFSVFLT